MVDAIEEWNSNILEGNLPHRESWGYNTVLNIFKKEQLGC